MKQILLTLFASLVMLASFAQSQQVLKFKTIANRNFDYGRVAVVTTTDSTLTTIDSIPIAALEGGIVEVQAVGFNDSLGIAVTGTKTLRYTKAAGTLTLGTPANILTTVTDSGLSAANWYIVASGNNLVIKVQGKLTYKVFWKVVTKRTYQRPG